MQERLGKSAQWRTHRSTVQYAASQQVAPNRTLLLCTYCDLSIPRFPRQTMDDTCNSTTYSTVQLHNKYSHVNALGKSRTLISLSHDARGNQCATHTTIQHTVQYSCTIRCFGEATHLNLSIARCQRQAQRSEELLEMGPHLLYPALQPNTVPLAVAVALTCHSQ